MCLQERCRNGFRDRTLDRGIYGFRHCLAPAHTYYLLCGKDVGEAECECRGRSYFNVVVAAHRAASDAVNHRQTARRGHLGARLVECEASVCTYLAKHEVETAAAVDFSLILAACLINVLFGYFFIEGMDIPRHEVNLADEHVHQTVQSARLAVFRRIEVGKIEEHYVLEADLLLLV